jgi:hypothetical protein
MMHATEFWDGYDSSDAAMLNRVGSLDKSFSSARCVRIQW